MNLFSLFVVLAVGAIGCAGGGFMSLAILHWAWKGRPASDPAEGWPMGQRLLLAGAVLGIVFGVLKLMLWHHYQG